MEKCIKYCGNESTIYKVNKCVIGKTYGLNYQFLDDNYNSVQPNGAVCCKDFLQDVVFVETTMQKCLEIYNYSYEYTGILEKQAKLILALDYGITDSNLVDLVSNVQNFINKYEEYLGFDKTVIVTDDDKTIALCHFSKQWIDSPILLSLYLLIVRYCLTYKEEEDIFNYLLKPTMKYNMESNDSFCFVNKGNRVIQFMKDLPKILTELPKWTDLIDYVGKPNYTTNRDSLNYVVHYSGMMAFIQFISNGTKV